MDDIQYSYHYYYYIPQSKVFKESALGNSNLDAENVKASDIRIAKISELNINPCQLR
ncbi:hypothetical protein [Myxosarcina sp. GI1]|uniref:hypothetical protein n=1 Tax=Myxosarcina sp. GI1 TaxID=1541065 RepID=UPI0012E095A3|nr:hypothetical protein [Myxosarcina sp. GI1]